MVEADLQRDGERGRRAHGLPHEARFAELERPSDLGHLVLALIDEGKAVAAAAGVTLREDPWEMNVHATRRGSRHYPSMLEDVEAHRPTEIELITGALVREGERTACPSPSTPRSTGSSRRRRPGRPSSRRREQPCQAATGARRAAAPPGGPSRGTRPFEPCPVPGTVTEVSQRGGAREGLRRRLRGGRLAVRGEPRDSSTTSRSGPTTSRASTSTRSTATGFRLTGAGEVVGRVRATADAGELPACDFGIVATKAMHTGGGDRARPRTRLPNGCVATVQNGIGNEEALAEHVERVIRGTTFPAGKVVEPGVVQWDVKGDTTLGPFEPKPAPAAEIERLAEACTRAGMPTSAVADARGPQWRKVIFNAATNPIGALTGLTHGARLRAAAAAPARVAARRRRQGRRRPVDRARLDPEELIDHAAKPEVAYDHKASMLQDVEARRPTEVDYLNGGIVRFGREHGVPTPLNEAIWALVKGVEDSWQQ